MAEVDVENGVAPATAKEDDIIDVYVDHDGPNLKEREVIKARMQVMTNFFLITFRKFICCLLVLALTVYLGYSSNCRNYKFYYEIARTRYSNEAVWRPTLEPYSLYHIYRLFGYKDY